MPLTATLIDVTGLTSALDRFAVERDWNQFHSPKNLVMALAGEVGELSAVFQWMSESDSLHAATNPDTSQAVKEELADVLLYLVRLSAVLGVDLDLVARQKLDQNAVRYPVDRSHGTSKKYSKS